MTKFHLAIDGPAGSGKSTISALIAEKLKWTHIDTGAMYRAVTLYALENNINLNNESEYEFLENIKITYVDDKIYLNNRDVSEEIRSDSVTKNVSLVSSFPYVRRKMVDLQQDAAKNINVVMDGRDIGTYVLPNANVKIFLTASSTIRAARRYKELMEKGIPSKLEKIEEEIIKRDKQDSERKMAPLKQAKDAILINTSDLSITDVIKKIEEILYKKE